MDMFRVEFYVDDKNLGEAFKRLAGLARNISHNFVPNLEPKPNGKVHQTSGDSMDAFIKQMNKRHWTEVDADKARTIVVDMGFSKTSYSYLLQSLVKAGLLTKKKSGKGVGLVYMLKVEK
jgi:hypothetical protein